MSIPEIIQQHLDRYEKEHGPQKWDRALNFGCGLSLMEPTDRTQWDNIDKTSHLSLPENYYDLIVAWHVLEHIPADEYLDVVQELWKSLTPNGLFVVEVPYGAHDMAWENPTHVRAFFPASFGFMSQPFYWREDYGYRGDFKTESIEINVPVGLWEDDIKLVHAQTMQLRNYATVMRGYLRAVKPARAKDRELQESPPIIYVPEV